MQPGTFDPKEGVIVLHNDEQGFVGIAAENTGAPRTLSDYFTMAFAAAIMAGMSYWLHDILTRDISLLPAVRSLAEDHPLKIALAEDAERKARLLQAGEKGASQTEGQGAVLATTHSVSDEEVSSTTEEAKPEGAGEVIETVTVPLPEVDPDRLSPVEGAIMTALQTEFRVAPDVPGVKVSLRPRPRPK